MHLAAVVDRSGIQIPFDLLQKAALYTPVADYLFDFHSQGLVTVRNLPLPTPGCQLALVSRTVRTCFGILCDLLEILLINYGKPSSGGSIDRGAGPPGVHQIGGPNLGQVCTT